MTQNPLVVGSAAMRFGRILHRGAPTWVELTPTSLHLLSAAPYAGGVETGERVASQGASWLACATPTKVVCVGRNYRAHAKELGHEVPSEPLLFLKPPSAVIASGEAIVRPRESARVEHEGELAVVIGRRMRRVPASEALAHVLGYTVANDVTARDLQRKDVQFTRAKGFDTFCPLGREIVTEGVGDETTVTVTVNGAVRQHGRVGDMVFSIATLLAYISDVMTLEPGDVVLTGTPEGVGPLVSGDRVEVCVSGVHPVENPVIDDVEGGAR